MIGCFRPLDPAEVVLGQFDGYRDVHGRRRPSPRTDTFVAARLWVDNDRWRGVPFLLRTGKRMAASQQRVSLVLREPAGPAGRQCPAEANVLSLLAGRRRRDRPVPGGQEARRRARPGPGTAPLPLSGLAGADPLPPYVRLIHDVLIGDRSLFTRPDGLAAAWKAVTPLLTDPPRVASVRAGLVGAGRGPQAHRAGPVAAGAVAGLRPSCAASVA